MGAFVSNANDINVANNYRYDAEGRLIQDEQEEIAEIQWRVDGKVKKIVRTPTSLRKNLSFDYDAMGNRIAKHIELLDGTRLSSTYYILDAQGNPLAMYELNYGDTQNPQASFELTERQIYGSARLGSLKTKVDVFGSAYEDYTDEITTHAIGDRNYELSNHLGNVLTVVSDKLHALDNGNGVVSGFSADLVMSCDYSPFGVTLEDRGVEGSYRFGFNSMEADDEIKGDGNSYDFGARMYDSRVGRWLTIDALTGKKPNLSSYQFSRLNPIVFIDPDGHDEFLVVVINDARTGKTTVIEKVDAVSTKIMCGKINVFAKYYDFETVITYDFDVNGKLTMNVSYNILYDNGIKDKDLIHDKNRCEMYGHVKDGPSGPTFGSWEGDGGKQAGGFHLTTKEGGASQTKQTSENDAETRNIEDLLNGLPGVGKSIKPSQMNPKNVGEMLKESADKVSGLQSAVEESFDSPLEVGTSYFDYEGVRYKYTHDTNQWAKKTIPCEKNPNFSECYVGIEESDVPEEVKSTLNESKK